jgi:hypothetical protein
MNVRKNIGFPLLSQGMPSAEIRRRVEETARCCASTISSTIRLRACRRRPPARGARPRHRARPKCFLMDEPLGTLDAEFRDLMVHELRALHNRIQRDDGLCHPRPDRGHVDGRQDRGDEPRRHRAVRDAAGDLRPPATMFVADFIGSPPMNFIHFEGTAMAGSNCRARSSPLVQGAKVIAVPEVRERISRLASWRSAFGPNTYAFTTPRPAARRSLRHRISRHDPDRRVDASRHHQGTCAGRNPAFAGDRVGLDAGRSAVAVRLQGVGPGDPLQSTMHCHEEARMADVTSRTSPRASANRPSPISSLPSAMASSSCCWGRRAPARRRRCG